MMRDFVREWLYKIGIAWMIYVVLLLAITFIF
jgi:hypothetical protein